VLVKGKASKLYKATYKHGIYVNVAGRYKFDG